jgi:phosphate transport system substrate-binding protein
MSLTDSFASVCRTCLLLAAGAAPVLAQGIAQTRAAVSPSIPKYVASRPVTEEVRIAGTDSLADSATEWDNGFRNFQPQSRVSFTPQLSTAAIQGLIQGTSTIVLSARDMTSEEQAAFQTKNGYAPTRIPLCLDAIIVFVNKGNPINEISLDQLDAIYSSTRLTGTKLTGESWGDFGARGDWKKRNIVPYSREDGAAIRSWFGTTVLRKGGKFKDTVQSRLDAMGLAEAVMTDPTGVAFSSMQSWYSSVKVIAVAPQDGQKAEPPSQEAVYAGKYPLVRSFYIFVNKAPGKPMAPAYQEFAKYLLSYEGQNTLADTGFIPAPPDFILMGSKRLN